MSRAWSLWGEVLKPHGLKGGVKVRLNSPAAPATEGPKEVYVRAPNAAEYRAYEVLRWSQARPQYYYVWLAGITSLEEAEALRGQSLYIKTAIEPKPAWHPRDCKGMWLYDGRKKIGLIETLYTYPQQYIWGVRCGEDEILVPARAEWMDAINEKEGWIRLRLPEGLIDINNSIHG